jgi:hypothetical protein
MAIDDAADLAILACDCLSHFAVLYCDHLSIYLDDSSGNRDYYHDYFDHFYEKHRPADANDL